VIRGGAGIFSDLYAASAERLLLGNARPYQASWLQEFPRIRGGWGLHADGCEQRCFQNASQPEEPWRASRRYCLPQWANYYDVTQHFTNPKYGRMESRSAAQFGPNTVASINYVGNHGTDESFFRMAQRVIETRRDRFELFD